MFTFAPELTRAKTAARSVFSIFDTPPSILGSVSTQDLTIITPRNTVVNEDKFSNTVTDSQIEFRHVDFSYPSRPNIPALKDVSFLVQSGQFIGIVGRSGSGKSSTLALIERFHDPCRGQILIDGQDISKLSAQQHRSRLGFVSQDSGLFAGSVAFNIRLGARTDQTVTQEDIEDICKKCNIHEFIVSLPDSYATECGQNGSRLSGGQRQRIALARAMVRRPDILLLDEPTSQLDALVERDIQQAISAYASGSTVIMVTHKIANVQHADRVLVYDKGVLVEQGRHMDLVKSGGVYARLANIQASGPNIVE
jgi:ATP-binding cassette subfamily B (MDR/TAP) protein 1